MYRYKSQRPVTMNGVSTLPKGKAFYDDPVKKIKHDMGYNVEPDRYEQFPSWAVSDIVSIQPMTASSGVIFQYEYKSQEPATKDSDKETK